MSEVTINLDRLSAIDLLQVLRDYEKIGAPDNRPSAPVTRGWVLAKEIADEIEQQLTKGGTNA